MHLFDAHCHLQDERLAPHLDAAMERAGQAGVTGLMCCGSSEDDWPLLPEIARRWPGVQLSFGLHPWYIGGRRDSWLDTLKTHLASTPSAVGEIGMDHALDKATFADQETVFLAQIHLANELGCPVSIHCRRAWGRLMELLDQQGWPAAGFVLHSYSGSADLIQPLARRGAFFSFSGAITFEQNRKGREAASLVPPDRLLIETDAPDLPPALPPGAAFLHDACGKAINEPAHLRRILSIVAELRGTDSGSIAAITTENAKSLWRQELTTSSGSGCR
jgi:TatD DNase family protein